MRCCIQYSGNCPDRAVIRAKHAVVHRRRGSVISMVEYHGTAKIWTDSVENHDELLGMLREAWRYAPRASDGDFFVNEYRHVIVPSDNGAYHYAGVYPLPVSFLIGASVYDGRAVDRRGHPLKKGSPWPWPPLGVPYGLNGGEIRLRSRDALGVVRAVVLTDANHSLEARSVTESIVELLGPGPGVVLVNECRETFGWSLGGRRICVYLGMLPDRGWFPDPLAFRTRLEPVAV